MCPTHTALHGYGHRAARERHAGCSAAPGRRPTLTAQSQQRSAASAAPCARRSIPCQRASSVGAARSGATHEARARAQPASACRLDRARHLWRARSSATTRTMSCRQALLAMIPCRKNISPPARGGHEKIRAGTDADFFLFGPSDPVGRSAPVRYLYPSTCGTYTPSMWGTYTPSTCGTYTPPRSQARQ